MKTISEFLKASDMTLTDLARAAGVSKGHMSEIAHGTRTPSLPVALKIYKASGKTIAVESLVATAMRGSANAANQEAAE